MAPEYFLDLPRGKEVDYWSLGVTIYMLLVGDFPFYSTDKEELVEQTLNKELDFTSINGETITT